MFVCFLVIHVIAAILDPFAKLGLSDALIPFTSTYRPLWLGMGVVAAEVAVAVLLTSAIRGRIVAVGTTVRDDAIPAESEQGRAAVRRPILLLLAGLCVLWRRVRRASDQSGRRDDQGRSQK